MSSSRDTVASLLRALRWPIDRARRGTLRSLDSLEILLGGFGLVAALVAAALLSPALGALPGAAGDFAPIGMAVLLAPVGITVALGRRTEIERLFRSVSERTDAITTSAPSRPERTVAIVVDTSAIIDGRLVEVVQSGFVLGDLIVPRFVLDELRRVADSSDPLKRQRGRRGMEHLAQIQADDLVHTTIDEERLADAGDVDARLVALARARGAAILTTDFNLARVAELESLRVLNLNVLAQAVRTVVLPGERLQLTIHEKGRERQQGVGYLDDGTMVVVEDAGDQVGTTMEVAVSRAIQTSAGRMVFAVPAREEGAATASGEEQAAP
jgi:uncharacterized protein YacL